MKNFETLKKDKIKNKNLFRDFHTVPNLKFDIDKLRSDLLKILKLIPSSFPKITKPITFFFLLSTAIKPLFSFILSIKFKYSFINIGPKTEYMLSTKPNSQIFVIWNKYFFCIFWYVIKFLLYSFCLITYNFFDIIQRCK